MEPVKEEVREAESERTATPEPPAALAPLRGVSNAALARALRDGAAPDLKPGGSNSAMARLLQRKGPDDPTGAATEVPEVPDTGKGGVHAWEYAFKKKVGDRASVSFKLGFNPSEHKAAAEGSAKTEGGGAKASVGFWESKVARENVGGQAATKISASLLKAGGAIETPIPGVSIEAQTKLFEAQVENAKDEAEINAIVVSFAIKGDVTEWGSEIAGVPEEERGKWKITISGEAKVAPSLSDLARIRDMWKAKKEMKAAAEALEVAAKRAEVVHDQLKAASSEIKALEKELKGFQGYGKQQKKLYATKKAYEEAKAAKRALLAEKRAAKVALEAEKKALKKTIQTQSKALKAATGVLEKAASGLKSKAGRAMGKVLATQAAKSVARILAKAIPIINIISVLWDLKDIAVLLYKVSQGAEIEFGMGGGEGGEGGEEGEGGEGGDGGAGDGGAEGTGDSGATEGTGGGDGTGTDIDRDSDIDSDTGDGGTAGDGGPTAPTESTEPPKADINPNARTVADAMKGGKVKLDDEMRRHLDFAVPADLSAEQVAELTKRIKARLGGKTEDPYEIIGIIQEEAEKILRGDKPEAEETFVDGERRPDLDQQLSTPDPAAATPAPPGTTPAPENKQPDPATVTKPAGGTGDKPAARAEVPSSLLPKLPGLLTWDEQAKAFAWQPNREQALYDATFALGDGLQVAVTQASLSSETQETAVIGTLSLEVMVVDLPGGVGADYPWKAGMARNYSLRFYRDLATGKMGMVDEDAATTAAFEAALEFKGGTFSVKKGAVIDARMATLRVEGIANQSTQEAGDTFIHTVGVRVTPTAVKGDPAGIFDASGAHIPFVVGRTVVVQLQFEGKK